MSENSITTLSAFLNESGAEFRVFDMGRRVTKVSKNVFSQFENAQLAYPSPFQRTAFFGIIFWHPQFTDAHYVWFLKFPLDEQGMLIQATRDEFLVMLLDRVGECLLAAADGKTIEGALKDSPYSYTPREDKMAAFNAQASSALKLSPSSYYADAKAYFSGEKSWDSWQTLAMQGVADVAIKTDDKLLAKDIIKALPQLPPPPFQMLASFMENAQPSHALVEALQWRLKSELEQVMPNTAEVTACIRAVSNSTSKDITESMIQAVLVNECSNNIEVLAVIAGRCWERLAEAELCQSYVERLALNDAGYDGFSHILADLMFIPELRIAIMSALRNPQRSEALSKQVGQMFGA
ncbi:MAG TPA: DUF3549 family protein [Methylophaga aminisulfidivorans]|uniref:DUF3549 family protein n=2 Tax=root TaxID=1 RepID=A0A7C1ZRA4_9GAMM|nr:DUF3549 family protein [Methylophaga aminisulfidivorans]HEC74883.1 DUF3549 family protein [Methylophaga aminisulfidivorans]